MTDEERNSAGRILQLEAWAITAFAFTIPIVMGGVVAARVALDNFSHKDNNTAAATQNASQPERSYPCAGGQGRDGQYTLRLPRKTAPVTALVP